MPLFGHAKPKAEEIEKPAVHVVPMGNPAPSAAAAAAAPSPQDLQQQQAAFAAYQQQQALAAFQMQQQQQQMQQQQQAAAFAAYQHQQQQPFQAGPGVDLSSPAALAALAEQNLLAHMQLRARLQRELDYAAAAVSSTAKDLADTLKRANDTAEFAALKGERQAAADEAKLRHDRIANELKAVQGLVMTDLKGALDAKTVADLTESTILSKDDMEKIVEAVRAHAQGIKVNLGAWKLGVAALDREIDGLLDVLGE
jgi:hypothetical protein